MGGSLRQECRQFLMKFQQLTAPVAAKGVEDTSFYRYNRLISLNEVGGDPERFGLSISEFHAFNQRQATRWPDTLLATSTHDTKRGEDARATISVLSEIPAEWERALLGWQKLNASRKQIVSSKPAPDAFDRGLTLAGVPAEEAVHVGDRVEEDVEGARAAGIAPVLVVREGEPPAVDPPVWTVRSLRELEGLAP